MSWLDSLKKGLKRTSALFSQVNPADLESVEEVLLMSDVGYETTEQLLSKIKREKPAPDQMKSFLQNELTTRLTPVAKSIDIPDKKPFVILMIGVNGAGKTTTIGKLAAQYKQAGQKLSLIAGDTFRAGAVEQLQAWGNRTNIPVHTGALNADSAGVIYDGLKKALENHDDIVLVDTAGRLQNKTNLMEELKKIKTVMKKLIPDAPHLTCLVLDATVGQNAISQVESFQEIIGVDGLMMTKLDGTAKGGILIALADRFHLPIYAIGVGEQINDLHPFTAADYVDSLLKDMP